MRLIWRGNTQYVLARINNTLTYEYFNAATVTANVKAPDGSSVTGNVSMAYRAGSNGEYLASISSGLALTDGVTYTLHIDATQDGVVGHWEIPILARTRNTQDG